MLVCKLVLEFEDFLVVNFSDNNTHVPHVACKMIDSYTYPINSIFVLCISY